MSEDLSLSEELRGARESRGDTLEQVHQLTGIALSILQGLERGDLQVVEAVYTRLAVVHYAAFLGLDGDALARRFDRESGTVGPRPVPVRTLAPGGSSPLPAPSPLADLLRTQPPGRLAAVGVGLVVILSLALYLLSAGGSDGDAGTAPVRATAPAAPEREARRSPTSSSVTADTIPRQAPAVLPASAPEARPEPTIPEMPTTDTADAPTSDTAAANTESAGDSGAAAPESRLPQEPAATLTPPPVEVTPAADPGASDSTAGIPTGVLVLQVEAVDSTWVQVQWDGVDGTEEIIPVGEHRRWAADRFFMVRAGRAHGVHFRFQGALLGDGRLGDPTRVLRFHASSNGVQLLGPDLEPIAPIVRIPPATTESSQPGVP